MKEVVDLVSLVPTYLARSAALTCECLDVARSTLSATTGLARVVEGLWVLSWALGNLLVVGAGTCKRQLSGRSALENHSLWWFCFEDPPHNDAQAIALRFRRSLFKRPRQATGKHTSRSFSVMGLLPVGIFARD